ncbi:MAG: CotH protein [Bacteroidetes bacterium]|nr:CotH protein [Bacteroidota bacterium]
MKPIKTPTHKTSPQVKLAVVLVLLTGVVSFVLSLGYSGENRKEYPELKYGQNLLSPECSAKGGFYADAFSLSLGSPSKIYYTLDGSMPTLRSAVYEKPVIIQNRTSDPAVYAAIPTSARWTPPLGDVFKGTVLRAIAVSDDNKKSKELIRTFFVDEKANKRYDLPVIALTVEPDDFFGYRKGIYVLGKNYEDKRDYIRKQLPLDLAWWEYPSNYLKRGDNSERPVHIEFYEPGGKIGFESDAGARINGNATRGFSQKSLRICFDGKYGQEQLEYPLFPGNPVTTFNSFILRNGGNDWNKTMFRDEFMQGLMKDSHVDIQDHRDAIVFINGEYWGIHNVRERSDEDFLANKYHISKDSIVVLEHGGILSYGKKRDTDDFKSLLDFIRKSDMSKQENYQYVLDKIDVLSFMDFVIANVYFCNSDWPNNNVKFWRYRADNPVAGSKSGKDGRWRWILYDTDWGFGYTGNASVNMDLLEKARKMGSTGVIFNGLLRNNTFREAFKERFLFHLDSTFNKEKVIAKIDEFEKILSPAMPEHIDRWRAIGSYNGWKANVKEMMDFAAERPAVQRKQLDEFLNKNR